MMDAELKIFINENLDLINENTKESWEEIYERLPKQDNLRGDFTQTILDAGINDPAEILGYIPDSYLYESTITNYKIPDNVTSIGSSAFYNCSTLTEIVIPDSVTSIDYRVFSSCSSLTSVMIPDGVMSIGQYAFYNCISLPSIVLPGSVTQIGWDAFENCTSLKEIHFKGTKTKWNNIIKGSDWRNNSSIKRIICNDGVIEL